MEHQIHLILVSCENVAHLEVVPIRHASILDHLLLTLSFLRTRVVAVLTTAV